jgi:hypothetical protein
VPHDSAEVFLFIMMELDLQFQVETTIIRRLSRPYWTSRQHYLTLS